MYDEGINKHQFTWAYDQEIKKERKKKAFESFLSKSLEQGFTWPNCFNIHRLIRLHIQLSPHKGGSMERIW